MKFAIIGLVSMGLVLSCKPEQVTDYQELRGETMGTYYMVKFKPSPKPVSQDEIDQILGDLNQALSTYDRESIISRFNQSKQGIDLDTFEHPIHRTYFEDNLKMAKKAYELTNGYFDPTVMPLVNHWGFGYQDREWRGQHDSTKVMQLMQAVGFDKVHLSDEPHFTVAKEFPELELDLSAIAKGYAVDQLADFLTNVKGIEHYFIDIGGENRALGVNGSGVIWKTGIATPDTNAASMSYDFIVHLRNQAIATSGNYRNFYQVDGQYISHTINPKTGFFERNTLLSASIIMSQCAAADAIATACMAMGYKRARHLIERSNDIEGILIYQEGSGEPKYFKSTAAQVDFIK